MRLDRFFINLDLSKKELPINDGDFVNQIKNVLRLKAGNKMILCDGQMNESMTQIISYSKNSVELIILETRKNENEPKRNVTLYCPILKKENFEWALQKAVEVGVKEIVPLITSRTVKLGLRYDRLNKIIKESAEQSGRGILPKLFEAINFGEAIEKASRLNDLNILFDKSGEKISAMEPLPLTVNIFVGPEGGWTEEEIKNARSRGFKLARLGKTILRAETAVAVSSFLACL